jgi:hypothetical protein
MKAIIEENVSFGVVYMGGFLIEEKPLIDLCKFFFLFILFFSVFLTSSRLSSIGTYTLTLAHLIA